MWREFVLSLAPDAEFRDPASATTIVGAEQALSVKFPKDLVEFLLESDGMFAFDGAHVINSVEEIREVNLEHRSHAIFRENFMAFDSLLL